MKQYIGAKIILATPAINIGGKIYPREAPIPIHGNDVTVRDGYKVVYEGGYESWSPKEPFERAYRRTDDMSFGLAIEAMKMGKRVARRGWNGKKQYIELASCISYTNPDGEITNAQHDAIGNQAIAFVGTSGVQMGWLASQADMLADDWEIRE